MKRWCVGEGEGVKNISYYITHHNAYGRMHRGVILESVCVCVRFYYKMVPRDTYAACSPLGTTGVNSDIPYDKKFLHRDMIPYSLRTSLQYKKDLYYIHKCVV